MPAFRLFFALALAMVGLATAAPASAQSGIITAAEPDAIAEIVRGKGFEVEVTLDSDGDPMIRAEGEDIRFIILFYGCQGGQNCTNLGLYANWSDSEANVDRINAWNRENRFGRAYLDKDNDPVLEMDIDLKAGGMSRALFEDHIENWLSTMSNYARFIFEDA